MADDQAVSADQSVLVRIRISGICEEMFKKNLFGPGFEGIKVVSRVECSNSDSAWYWLSGPFSATWNNREVTAWFDGGRMWLVLSRPSRSLPEEATAEIVEILREGHEVQCWYTAPTPLIGVGDLSITITLGDDFSFATEGAPARRDAIIFTVGDTAAEIYKALVQMKARRLAEKKTA